MCKHGATSHTGRCLEGQLAFCSGSCHLIDMSVDEVKSDRRSTAAVIKSFKHGSVRHMAASAGSGSFF